MHLLLKSFCLVFFMIAATASSSPHITSLNLPQSSKTEVVFSKKLAAKITYHDGSWVKFHKDKDGITVSFSNTSSTQEYGTGYSVFSVVKRYRKPGDKLKIYTSDNDYRRRIA